MWTILKGRETAWINSHLIRPRGRACLSRMHTNAHKFVLFLLSRLLCVSTLRSAASSSVSFGFARKVVKKGSGHRRVSFASTFFRFSEDTRIPRASRPSSVFENNRANRPRSRPSKILLAERHRHLRGSFNTRLFYSTAATANIVLEREKDGNRWRRNFTFGLVPSSGIFAGGKNIFKHRAGEKVVLLNALVNGGARVRGFPPVPFEKENSNNRNSDRKMMLRSLE